MSLRTTAPTARLPSPKTAGAVVYERNNPTLVGKGYALDFLLKRIGEDYPENTFDGYFVFDADNVLEPDYIYEMNKVFSPGIPG